MVTCTLPMEIAKIKNPLVAKFNKSMKPNIRVTNGLSIQRPSIPSALQGRFLIG
jgi:hypothetical protein